MLPVYLTLTAQPEFEIKIGFEPHSPKKAKKLKYLDVAYSTKRQNLPKVSLVRVPNAKFRQTPFHSVGVPNAK